MLLLRWPFWGWRYLRWSSGRTRLDDTGHPLRSSPVSPAKRPSKRLAEYLLAAIRQERTRPRQVGFLSERCNGDGTFIDVTERAGVAAGGWSAAAAFGDLNGDGNLDLVRCPPCGLREAAPITGYQIAS